jgi:hypothetical protein
MGERTRIVMAALGSLALVGALAACSSSQDTADTGPAEPTASATFATATPVADGTKIATGKWGIVQYTNSSSGDEKFALRVTAVSKGKPGDFSGITDFGGGDLTPKNAVGWWIDYDWVVIDGDGTWSPNQLIGAVTANAADQDKLSTLSVPADYVHCKKPDIESLDKTKTGLVQHGCLTAAASKGAKPAGVYFSDATATKDVTWALPQAKG